MNGEKHCIYDSFRQQVTGTFSTESRAGTYGSSDVGRLRSYYVLRLTLGFGLHLTMYIVPGVGCGVLTPNFALTCGWRTCLEEVELLPLRLPIHKSKVMEQVEMTGCYQYVNNLLALMRRILRSAYGALPSARHGPHA